MDQIKLLITRLKDRIPNCCYCDRSIYEEKAYVAFECFHVVCFECTDQDIGVACAKCPKGEILDIDYQRLEVARSLLAASLKSLTDSDAKAFPTVFASFYEVWSVMTEVKVAIPEIRDEEKVAMAGLPPQKPEEWKAQSNLLIPNQVPASQPSVSQSAASPVSKLKHEDFPSLASSVPMTKCKCGNTYPSTQSCRCTFIVPESCPDCHISPCICEDTMSANQLWNCWDCGYEYNYKGSGACGRCGKVIRGGGDHSRPRRRSSRRSSRYR